MRYAITAAAAAPLAAFAPAVAFADTISFDVPVMQASAPRDPGPTDVTLPLFNASLGTLTGETLTFKGGFAPGEDWILQDPYNHATGPVPVTLAGGVGIFPPGHTPLTLLPGESLTAYPQGLNGTGGYTAGGNGEPFSVSAALPAADLDTPGWEVWAETIPSKVAGYWPGADLGSFDADVTVTYDYTPASVPEPAALPLLAVGLVGLCGAALKRR